MNSESDVITQVSPALLSTILLTKFPFRQTQTSTGTPLISMSGLASAHPHGRRKLLIWKLSGWNAPSPLVSVTKSLLRALHIAIKIGPDSFLSVIDLQAANVDGRVEKATDLHLTPNTFYIASGEVSDLFIPFLRLSI